jgi:hypothetical protein
MNLFRFPKRWSIEVKGTKIQDNLRMFVAYSSTSKVDKLDQINRSKSLHVMDSGDLR